MACSETEADEAKSGGAEAGEAKCGGAEAYEAEAMAVGDAKAVSNAKAVGDAKAITYCNLIQLILSICLHTMNL